ncbi:MAG: RNA polymerase factor sigma-54 [Pseudomonadota bacterium]
MGLSQSLAQRQGQSLVMTPQLSQSIKLLAMSNIELASFVENELEKNPFLEAGKDATAPVEMEPVPTPEISEDSIKLDGELQTSANALESDLGTSVENVFPDEQDYRSDEKAARQELSTPSSASEFSQNGLQIAGAASTHDTAIADYTADQPSLHDHLDEQLAMSGASRQTAFIVRNLIEAIDESGYVRADIEDMAARLSVSTVAIEAGIALLQSFEPAGIGARNLAECLRLQLAERNRFDPAIAAVLDNLDLLAKRDFAQLQSVTGLSIEDLHDSLNEIRTLDPKPGFAFRPELVEHVSPDVMVSESPDGAWRIELNSDTLPRVLVNNTYAAEVKKHLRGDEERTFLSECMQNASWLSKSLDQRAQTILKVAKEIVKQQDAFLVYGVTRLKPMTLRAVADAIDMHESSVSRVTSNKYIMTPRGMFEMKYFFTTAIGGTSTGEAHSAEAIRAQIRALIELEEPSSVLSDDAIVAALKITGVDIARRTITKYREAMNIPSSVQRRREKRAAAKAREASGSVGSLQAAE